MAWHTAIERRVSESPRHCSKYVTDRLGRALPRDIKIIAGDIKQLAE
jgi:hypothetical protein